MSSNHHERIDATLKTLYEADTTDGLSERAMQRIAIESHENIIAERTRFRPWKRSALFAAVCATSLIGVVCYYSLIRDKERWLAGAESDSAGAVGDGLVILKLPADGEAARQMAKSDWLPEDFVLLTGRFANPKGRGDRRTVELKVDRVIKGDAGNGSIITKDELPAFCCSGPVVASSVYPVGKPIMCWLTREHGKWKLVETTALTQKLTRLLDAVTGDNQAALLRPLITPTGLDFQTAEMIKLVASPEQVTPLLKEIVRETPPMLEPFQGASGPSYDADWQQRMKLVSYRLSPALDILCRFSKSEDTELVDLILPCYAPLSDKGGDRFRFYLNVYLKGICAAAQQEDGKTRLSANQINAIRAVSLSEIEGVRDQKSLAANSACATLGFLTDSKTVTALLRKLEERPIHDFHESIAVALFQIAWGGNATEADDVRIRAAWIAELESFDKEEGLFENESDKEWKVSFANEIAGFLYQVDISVQDLRALRELHGQTKTPWLRRVVERFARKMIPAPRA